VAQIGDGVVAMPADARTQGQMEWVAEEVEQAGGTAIRWVARSASGEQERRLAEEMAAARVAGYDQVRERAAQAIAEPDPAAAGGVLRRLRGELRRIERRDYFAPVERDIARGAVRALADQVAAVDRERA